MYNIGDKIMYPMHGAGIIEAIEEKEILGEKNKYYILNICANDIKVMLPIEHTEAMGIRPVISLDEAMAVLKVISEKPTEMNKNWTKRYRDNEIKIKNGSPSDIAEVIKNLTLADHKKKLSPGEKKILMYARQILVSELMLVLDKTKDEVDVMLDKIMTYQPAENN